MTLNCNFCGNNFIDKIILKRHQKTAKYCIKLQGLNIESCNKKYTCNFCEKDYTQKIDLSRHLANCKEKQIFEIISDKDRIISDKDKIIDKYEKQIKDLQDKLIDIISSRPTIVNNVQNNNNNHKINTIINNLLPITDVHLKNQAQYLTLEHIKKGATGYAEYALEYPLKNRIVCPDFSRRKINYKDEDGNLITDIEMKKICEKIFKSIEEQNTKLTEVYIKELKHKIDQLNNNANNMEEDVSNELLTKTNKILDYICKYITQGKDIIKASKGDKPDIINDFIKDICAKTILNK